MLVRSLAFVVCLLCAVLLLFPWVTHTKILLLCFMAGAVWLARNGGLCLDALGATYILPHPPRVSRGGTVH